MGESSVTTPPEISLLPAAAASDRELVDEITGLVDEVYAAAEAGLWVDGASRTTAREMAGMIASRQIAVAGTDGQTLGVVRVQQLDSQTGELGMLASDPAHRGEGVGRRLVGFAEELSRERGLTFIQLELLVPRGWVHPSKVCLHEWYTRLGYRPVRTGTIGDSYPQLAPLLATPCDFVVYNKDLRS
jgi:GNAT superfamily N-acetyltransferase